MMITDDDLTALIESAGAHAPSPSPLPEGLFQHEARTRTRRSYGSWAAPIAALIATFVLVGGIAALINNGGSSSSKTATAGRSSFDSAVNSTGVGATGAVSAEASGATAGSATAAAPGVQAQVPAIADTAKVIKNGSLELRVGRGTVTETMNRLMSIATGFGGYVSETRSTAASESQASATISLRVPSAAFEQMLAEASKLGEVRSTTTSGQDVTAQFTDIDAQLFALTATRDQLLLVLGEAKNVPDILAVQDRVTQVQIQIDQLEGQKRLLTDQTSFGTLSVTLLEPGATAAVTPIEDDEKDLGDAWRAARRNFGNAVESIVEASGTLAVLAIGGVIAWFVYRAIRRRALTL